MKAERGRAFSAVLKDRYIQHRKPVILLAVFFCAAAISVPLSPALPPSFFYPPRTIEIFVKKWYNKGTILSKEPFL